MAGILIPRRCCCVICTSDSTCNRWCDTSKKAFSRGMDCDCPCPDRRDFPVAWRMRWYISFDMLGTFRAGSGYSAGDFQVTEAPSERADITYSLFGSSCSSAGYRLVEHYHPDDNSGDVDYSDDGGVAVVFVTSFNSCSTQVRFQVFLYHTTGFPSSPNGTCPDVPPYTAIIAEADSGWIDRCTESINLPVTTCNAIFDGATTVEIDAVCLDCAGNPPDYSADDPASICDNIDGYDIDLSDGATVTSVSFDSHGVGPVGYALSISTRTTEDTGEKCCPNRDPVDCSDCVNSADCEQCYEMHIVAPEGNYYLWGRGPCPQSATWTTHSAPGGHSVSSGPTFTTDGVC